MKKREHKPLVFGKDDAPAGTESSAPSDEEARRSLLASKKALDAARALSRDAPTAAGDSAEKP